MDRTNWIRYILTASDRASRRVLAADAAIRKSVKDTERTAGRSASSQSSSFNSTARAAENSSRRVVRSLNNQSGSSRAAREELRKFGFEQTRAWRAGAAFNNHLRTTNLHLTRLRLAVRNLALPALVAVFTSLAQAAGSAAGGLAALVGGLKPLVGLAATLPGGILGIAQAIGTLQATISPVGEALKQLWTSQKSAMTAAQTEMNRTESAARSLRDAQQGVADATRGVADAERERTDAQRQAEEAQRDVTRATTDARRELLELKNAAIDAALAQRGASLSLQEAEEQLKETILDPQTTMTEVRRAELAVDEARQQAKEARLEAHRAREESAKAQQRGPGKMPDVLAARRALADANRQVADTERGIADAQRGLRDAIENLADAQKDAADAGEHQTAAMANFQYAMQQLDPVGRRFVRFIASLKPEFLDLQRISQRGLLPGVQRGIESAMKNFPTLQRMVDRTSRTFGDLAERAGRLVGSKGFGEDLDRVTATNAVVMGRLGRAGLTVSRGLMDVAVAARPLTNWLSKLVSGWAHSWTQMIHTKRASGELRGSFAETREVVERLTSIIGHLWTGLGNIIGLAKPLGDSMFAAIDRAAGRFERWTASAKGRNTIEEFFRRIRGPLFEAGRLISALTKAMFEMAMFPGLGQIVRQIRVQLLPALVEITHEFGQAFGPSIVELLVSVLKLFEAMGHPLTIMVTTTARIVDAFTAVVTQVPGMKQLLGVIVGISLASRAISFVSAVSGVSSLIGHLRTLRTAKAEAALAGTAGAVGGAPGIAPRGRVSSTVAGWQAANATLGSVPARPMYVWVVNEVGGVPPGALGGRGRAPAATTVPAMSRAEAVAKYGSYAGGRYADKIGAAPVVFPTAGQRFANTKVGSAGRKVFGAFRGPKAGLAGGVAATAAVVGGSMIPGQIPGTDVGVGEAVSNIGGGALTGAMFGPWGAAIGAALGLLLTFRKQVADAFKWLVDFVGKHSLLVGLALTPIFGPLPLLLGAAIKWRHQIADVLGAAFDWIVNAAENTFDWLKNVVEGVPQFFERLPGRVAAGVKALPGLLWDALKKVPYVLGRFVGFFLTLPFRIGIAFVRLYIKIGGLLADLGPKLLRWGATAIGFLARAWLSGMKRLVEFWLSLPGRILRALRTLPGDIWDFGKRTLNKLLDGMKSGGPGLIHFVASLPGRIVHAIGKLASKIYEAGKNFAKEFARGVYDSLPGPIRDAMDWGAGAVSDAAGAIFGGGGGGGPTYSGRGAREAQRRQKEEIENSPFGKNYSPLPIPKKGNSGSGPDPDDKAHKKTRKNWLDTRTWVGQAADDIRKKVKNSSDDWAKSATSGSEKLRKGVTDKFDKASTGSKKSLASMAGATSSSFDSIVKTSKQRSQEFSGTVRLSMSSASSAVYNGMDYVVGTMNKSLKAFDADPVKIKVSAPKLPKRAGGGWVGAPGERGPDDQLVWMGRGEAVLNFPQQQVVAQSLMSTHGLTLDDLFHYVKTPHSGGFAGFSLGGFARFDKGGYLGEDPKIKLPKASFAGGAGKFKTRADVLGSTPGFIPFMNYLAQFDPSIFVLSGYRPGSITTSGNVSNHASGHAVDISNPQIQFATGPGSLAGNPGATRMDKIHAIIAQRFSSLPGDFLWRTYVGGNHYNHVHRGITSVEADSVAAMQAYISKLPQGGVFGKIPPPRITGTAGPPLEIAQRATKLGTAAANAYVSQNMRFKGGGVGKKWTGPISQVIKGRATWFNGGATAGGSDTSQPGLALNLDPSLGEPTGWNNPITQSWMRRSQAGNPVYARVKIGGKSTNLPITDMGPASWTGNQIDVTEGGVRKLGFTTSTFPSGTIGVAEVLKMAMGGKVGLGKFAAPRPGRRRPLASGTRKALRFDPGSPSAMGAAAGGMPVPFARRTRQRASMLNLLRLASGGTTGTAGGARIVGRADGNLIATALVEAYASGFKMGISAARVAPKYEPGPQVVSRKPFVPDLELEYTPPSAKVNKFFGTAKNPFPFTQYGFDPVELFDWEKFKKDPAWKRSQDAAHDALVALGKIPADKFTKWLKVLAKMDFKELGKVLQRIQEKVSEQAEKLRDLVTSAKDKDSPGGKKITKSERKTIKTAREALEQSQDKRSVVRRIRAPLVRFHNSIQNLSIGQLEATRKGIADQIEQIKKGGVSKKERAKLARLRGMMEDVTDTIAEHIRAILQAAEEAVASAAFAHNMADLGLQHLELEQQLAGTFETHEAKVARANYINSQIIPTLQAEEAALNAKLAAAREAGDTELARQVAEEIAAVQNGILQAQLDAQELMAEELEDLNDALTGTLGFSFRSQSFTDILGLGVGA